MKVNVYVFCVMTMLMCLAGCGKAVSSYETESREKQVTYIIEEERPMTGSEGEITVHEERMNIGFLQGSNMEMWQIVQTESFFMAFSEDKGYHLNILDAHGDAEEQRKAFIRFIDAPMDVIIVMLVDPADEEAFRNMAEEAGICVLFYESVEESAVSGEEVRRLLEEN